MTLVFLVQILDFRRKWNGSKREYVVPQLCNEELAWSGREGLWVEW